MPTDTFPTNDGDDAEIEDFCNASPNNVISAIIHMYDGSDFPAVFSSLTAMEKFMTENSDKTCSVIWAAVTIDQPDLSNE